jgi:hypothetical protein
VNLSTVLHHQQAPFSGAVAGDRQLEPYGDLSISLTNPNFIIAYMLAFLFLSLKVGEKLDTRRSRSSHPLRQDDGYIKIHSLVVGANFC